MHLKFECTRYIHLQLFCCHHIMFTKRPRPLYPSAVHRTTPVFPATLRTPTEINTLKTSESGREVVNKNPSSASVRQQSPFFSLSPVYLRRLEWRGEGRVSSLALLPPRYLASLELSPLPRDEWRDELGVIAKRALSALGVRGGGKEGGVGVGVRRGGWVWGWG
jgi:hypothetical protein